MNIKRFHAPTAREALAKARMAFGEGTLILSNRPVDGGVEVVATAEDTLSELHDASPRAALQTAAQPAPAQAPAAQRPAPQQPATRLQERADDLAASPVRTQKNRAALQGEMAQTTVANDTEQLAMSTLSFQDYVRERMLRRRQEAMDGTLAPAVVQGRERERAFEQAPMRATAPVTAQPGPQAQAKPVPRNPLRTMHAALNAPQVNPAARPQAGAAAPTLAAAAGQQDVMKELQAMKDLIEERFNTLSWLGQARQDPIQSNLMLKLIRAGYSPALARAMLEHLPDNLGPQDAVRWLMRVLERNLRTDAADLPLVQQGGVFALVGATGVGKTTTAAKLAALCAQAHGPASVGLITLDTYRMGAHEQLRSYGRMLGVVAHLAHDQAALQDLLGLLSSKKMVLIDTTGVAPRDPRKRELLDLLALPGIERLQVLNASSHGDTFDEVLTGFKSAGVQQAILSKVDEAVKLGPAIDALIRHQALLRGVTCGQRVPEDWEAANARQLVAQSMRANAPSAFDPKALELNFFFSQAPEAQQPTEMDHVA